MGEHGLIRTHTFTVPIDDIDTDQILPGEYLTTTESDGLGRYCFHTWRYDEKGDARKDHPLVGFEPGRHGVLVAGKNFGCGSSREHAAWALLDMGVRAVISSRFADIFRNNAIKNGLLPIALDEETAGYMLAHPDTAVTIDIPETTIDIEGLGQRSFELDPFSAHCLIEGMDQLDFLLQQEDLITAFEKRRP